MTTAAACLFAQGLKPFTAALAGQGFNWKLVLKSGGMPSSHSAVVTSLAAALCLERGASDPIFGAFAIYACIVMYDAQGVRRAVGKQAEVLNTLVVPDLARRYAVPPPVGTGHPHSAAQTSPPPTSIGMELAQDGRKAELAFVANGKAGSVPAAPVSSFAEGNGSPIGVELARGGRSLELAFVERREGGTVGSPPPPPSPPAESSSTAPQAAAEPLPANLISRPPDAADFDSRRSRTGTALPALSESRTGTAPNPGAASAKLPGQGNLESNGTAAPDNGTGASGTLPSVPPLSRSHEFWAAAAREPSMQEGEVVAQELGQMEGWRHIPLKESVGHTKPQVVTGAVAGIVLALILDSWGFYN